MLFICLLLYFVFQDWILSISVFDNDRYANHTELSTIQIPFKDLRKIFTNPEMNLFNYKMKQSNQVKSFYI